MGFADLFTRAVQYTATDTTTGASQTFVVDSLSPDWSHGAYSGAMSLPGAWRASLLISDLLGSLPWQVLRDRAGVQERLPTPPLLLQPSPPDTAVTTFSSVVLDLVWRGNAIGLIASRGRDGYPTSVALVPAESVQVRRAGRGEIGFTEGEVIYQIGQDLYPADEVIHVKGPSRPGALRGMSVLEAHLSKSLRLADQLDEQARSVDTAAVPSGVLKSTDPAFDESDARAVAAGWKANQRTRGLQIINSSMEYTPVAWNPTEAQLLEARKYSLHQIALIFGLSPSWLGVSSGDSMTYSNLESEATNLVRFSLIGHISRLEQAFSTALPRGTWAKLNLDGLLRSDTMTRYQAHEIGIRAGFLLPSEARGLEDLPPVDGIDEKALQSAEDDEDPTPEDAAQWAAELGEDRSAADVNALERYWKHGEGLAKWAGKAHPWTALYRQLVKHVGPTRAKRIASQWFHDVFGIWPGERKGTNPVGKG
ncbi:hypothetical protein GCM10010472_10780 [Pseudonocardia halophobica]|uniref:Phage portal protein n=1 Tax=Pseudonocardia halophobica TaxID=29401 RepID=A0A9W6NXH0_9PSEU|nr:phage portal protein [Pseudonocardia halophobica]GLL13465.1 hypothetical protein GCM10017577_46090 [Pseudonocardia halophobica]